MITKTGNNGEIEHETQYGFCITKVDWRFSWTGRVALGTIVIGTTVILCFIAPELAVTWTDFGPELLSFVISCV